jgi:hypothetical protein
VAQSQQFTPQFTSYFVAQNPAAEFPPCLITCILDDNPALVLPVISGSISMSRSQPSTWTITLDNDDGSCNLNATSGPFVGKFTCDPFDGSNAIRNFVRVKMDIGGQIWNSPKLLIQDAQESENATTHIVVISGADASEILFLKDQFMADVAGDDGGPPEQRRRHGDSLGIQFGRAPGPEKLSGLAAAPHWPAYRMAAPAVRGSTGLVDDGRRHLCGPIRRLLEHRQRLGS